MRDFANTLPGPDRNRGSQSLSEKADSPSGGDAMADRESASPLMDEKDMERMVDDVREMTRAFQRELDFRVEEDIDRTVVQVRDRENDEVIRQIPSDEMLELARNMERIRGLLFNEST
ncbi:flagellar protein FlaG [Thiohalospira halophila]|nr:flagellar protein FlaG [Thiohalospira halophila]